jgi:hypothetical protein
MKKCAKCKNEFLLENFPKDKTNASGYRSYCFPCNREKINKMTFNRKDKRKVENEKNKEYIQEYNKQYMIKNRKHINLSYKNRLHNDPTFKISHNTRVRINKALKNNYKFSSTAKLLGCTLDFYKEYLEKQFKHDMTWDNYGSLWEIDHIKPCFSFNLILEEEQKLCFHYLNTQPLYKIDNQRKNKH